MVGVAMTHPMNTVEKVAMALCRHEHRLEHPAADEATLDVFVERDWWTWEGYARAALTALREPSEGMKAKGADYVDARDPPGQAEAVWQAMISAALSEGEG
jgi:hypothetical protein